MKLIKEIKSRDGELHFRRYSIMKLYWFSIYIHKIYKEDQDEHLHDHPWNILTIILKGSYVEELLSKDKDSSRHIIRTFLNVGYRSTKRFHKIKDIVVGPVTTIAFVGRRSHELWGYHTERGWIDHKSYRLAKHTEESAEVK